MSFKGLDRVNVHCIVSKVNMHRNLLHSVFHLFHALLCNPSTFFIFVALNRTLQAVNVTVTQNTKDGCKDMCNICDNSYFVFFSLPLISCRFVWHTGFETRRAEVLETSILRETRRNSGIESLSGRLLQKCRTITCPSLCESYSRGYHISAVHSELKPINPPCLDSVTK